MISINEYTQILTKVRSTIIRVSKKSKRLILLKGFVLAMLCSLFVLCPSHYTFAQPIRQFILSEADPLYAWQSVGALRRNLSVTGKSLSVGSKRYKRGLGSHSNSIIRLKLYRDAIKLYGYVGVDNRKSLPSIHKLSLSPIALKEYEAFDAEETFIGVLDQKYKLQRGSVVFSVYLDEVLVWQSPIMYGGQPALPLELDLHDAQFMELVIEDAEDGKSGDHANWLDMRILYIGQEPQVIPWVQKN